MTGPGLGPGSAGFDSPAPDVDHPAPSWVRVFGLVAQSGSAPPRQGGGPGFESRLVHLGGEGTASGWGGKPRPGCVTHRPAGGLPFRRWSVVARLVAQWQSGRHEGGRCGFESRRAFCPSSSGGSSARLKNARFPVRRRGGARVSTQRSARLPEGAMLSGSVWRVRLAVRPPDSRSGNRGSTPLLAASWRATARSSATPPSGWHPVAALRVPCGCSSPGRALGFQPRGRGSSPRYRSCAWGRGRRTPRATAAGCAARGSGRLGVATRPARQVTTPDPRAHPLGARLTGRPPGFFFLVPAVGVRILRPQRRTRATAPEGAAREVTTVVATAEQHLGPQRASGRSCPCRGSPTVEARSSNLRHVRVRVPRSAPTTPGGRTPDQVPKGPWRASARLPPRSSG